MRIWTIQAIAAWEHLERHGMLLARREHQSTNWPEAYAWIREQLSRRVGPPPDENCVPLWGWYQRYGADKRRPDLRSDCYGYPPGEHVLIEFEVQDDRVMLSDFDAWHVALNDQYLELSQDELDAYLADRRRCVMESSDSLHEELRQRLQESWERIIELDNLPEPDWHPMERKSIQACFWELRLEEIMSFTRFWSRTR